MATCTHTIGSETAPSHPPLLKSRINRTSSPKNPQLRKPVPLRLPMYTNTYTPLYLSNLTHNILAFNFIPHLLPTLLPVINWSKTKNINTSKPKASGKPHTSHIYIKIFIYYKSKRTQSATREPYSTAEPPSPRCGLGHPPVALAALPSLPGPQPASPPP